MTTEVPVSSDTTDIGDASVHGLQNSLRLDPSMTLSNDTGIAVDVSTHDMKEPMKSDVSNLSNNTCNLGNASSCVLKDPKGKHASTSKDIPKAELLKQKAFTALKKFLVFMFSHVGLTCLVVSYSIFGAFIFQRLEQWNEKESRIKTSKLRNETLVKLWNATRENFILRQANWTDQVEHTLRSFEKEIYIATTELGWDGISNEAVGELHWSFTGSLLYSVTVITTIGYGHITPKTQWGRIVTMVYAFFGIPLTLLCLANIGALMGKGFLILYQKLPGGRRDFSIQNALPILQTTMPGENVNDEDGKNGDRNSVLVYIPTRPLPPPRHVPIIICCLLVIMYILVGTVIFVIWEKSWNVLTSAYFCFITLSTIGFGDVVPGHSLDSWQSQPKQFICTIYLLFGLTLLAMCFDLLQEQVRSIAKQFGEFIGIVDEEEEEVTVQTEDYVENDK